MVVEVALALVFRANRVLVTRRLDGVHLGGSWEFPGGKLRNGETAEACAVRELAEETGVVARARSRRPAIDWTYPERSVRLHPVDCEWLAGEGEMREVAELRWVTLDELSTLVFPPANAELVRALVGRSPPG